MQKAIQKAIEGGWKKGSTNVMSEIIPKKEYFLDPLFWQALSKVCKWNEKHIIKKSCSFVFGKDMWRHIAIDFYNRNLTQSFEKAVKWLDNLLPNT